MTSDVEQILTTATLVTELMANAGSAMTLYVTVVSGYLLVAYLVGKELTFLQTTIISTLFMIFTTLNAVATMTYMQNAIFFGTHYGVGRMPSWAPFGSGIVLFLGILASVKFMWDVRHPKTE